jgi:uncharacterized membrane protein YidH (DUF202 family)
MSIEISRESVESHKRLAQERTILANERNTLAYIRTGFSAFLFGFGLVEFLGDDIRYAYLGWGIIILGGALILLGLIHYPLRKKKIKSY